MKLNNFFDKPSKKITNQKIVTVVNDVKEKELEERVKSLQDSLNTLNSVKDENIEINKQIQLINSELNEVRGREANLENSKLLLEDDVKRGEKMKEEKTFLEGKVRDLTNTLGIQESNLEQAQKNNLELNTLVGNLNDKVETLEKDEEVNKVVLEEAHQKASASVNRLQEFELKSVEIEKNIDKIKVKYIELEKLNSENSRQAGYWKSVSRTLQDEKDHLEESRKMLKSLADTIEAENVETKGISKIKHKELNKLKASNKTMTENIDNLIDENSYLAGLSSALKEELSRPKYMSMSAIERSEGFKMPMGGSREHFLGHGKPTLLRFKSGGMKNDN